MKRGFLIAVALAAVSLSGCWNTQTGEKVGSVVRAGVHGGFSFCQSYEAELIRGGLNTGSGVMGTPFDFTVEDPQLQQVIEDALNHQTEIKVYYHKEFGSWCRSDTNFFVYKVEPFVK